MRSIHKHFAWPARGLTLALALFLSLTMGSLTQGYFSEANAGTLDRVPILKRHADTARHRAKKFPKSESDQAVVDGWPMYRTPRGQEAFNMAMATLQATEGPSPPKSAFRRCPNLKCRLDIPELSSRGWFKPGRLWISPDEYIVFVRSPRPHGPRGFRRRPQRNMKLFVYHEFHNSTRNTDTFDTISAHRRSIFTSFYMTTVQKDAAGRKFVFVVQVAPHNVVSRHASNRGNRGAGIEVAKNYGDPLAPLQAKAGIVMGHIITAAEPQLRVVHHRHQEGLPMLRAWQAHVRKARRTYAKRKVALPFTHLKSGSLTQASAPLAHLLYRGGALRKPLLVARATLPKVAPAAKPVVAASAQPPRPGKLPPPTFAVARTTPIQAQRVRVRTVSVAPIRVPRPQLVAAPAYAPRLISPPRLVEQPTVVEQSVGAPSVTADARESSITDLVRRIFGYN